MLTFEHHPILSRQYLDELTDVVVPLVKNSLGDRALRVLEMPLDQRMQLLYLIVVPDRTQLDHSRIAARCERAVFVKHVGHTAAHSGGEVTPGLAEHDNQPARHVLASVIADSLDNRMRTAVAH